MLFYGQGQGLGQTPQTQVSATKTGQHGAPTSSMSLLRFIRPGLATSCGGNVGPDIAMPAIRQTYTNAFALVFLAFVTIDLTQLSTLQPGQDSSTYLRGWCRTNYRPGPVEHAHATETLECCRLARWNHTNQFAENVIMQQCAVYEHSLVHRLARPDLRAPDKRETNEAAHLEALW